MGKTEELQESIDYVRSKHFADDPDEAPARELAEAIYEHLYNNCVSPPEADFQFDLERLLRNAFNEARKTGPIPARLREETWRAAVMACVAAVEKLPFGTGARDLLNTISDVALELPGEESKR